MRARRRENRHELIERFEGLSQIKTYVHLSEIDKVGSEGRVVVGVVPRPRDTALKIVAHDPAHPLDVFLDHLANQRRLVLLAKAVFSLIITLLITGFIKL